MSLRLFPNFFRELVSEQGDLNLYLFTLAFCLRFVLRAALMEIRLREVGQYNHQVVVTYPVPFSSRSEVSKLQPEGQMPSGDKFYK